ncbi:MAG TPA: hypothetical protein VHY09_15095 [Candidatus Methylacidiphilales bacterium]|jgi:hypothetical protein|nr:hypothetical protein [Candidatus Methylacidiphilales bacterium]
MKTVVLFFLVALTAFVLQPVRAQSDNSGPTPAAQPPADAAPAPGNAPAFSSSATQAVDLAQQSVDPTLRDRVVSVYGVGTPTTINRWWVIFYDPSVPSHGRAVKVENGTVAKTYEAQGGVVYQQELTFDHARVTGEGAALETAQNYAAQQGITYDGVRALLRRNSTEGPLRWRVQLLHGDRNKGFVFTNASNGSFAMYSPPGTVPSGHKSSTGSTGGLAGDAQHFGNDVKHTFLGIGGDLQEFFTGERTVDQ